MKKILIVTHCRECPHFTDTDTVRREWRETCRLNLQRVPWDNENRIYPIPDHCLLETLIPEKECVWVLRDDGQMGIPDWEYNTECGVEHIDSSSDVVGGEYCSYCGKRKILQVPK